MTAAKTLFCVSRPIRLRIEGFTTTRYDDPWSTLVEDEQRDRPNSQTTIELCHLCVAIIELVDIRSTEWCVDRKKNDD